MSESEDHLSTDSHADLIFEVSPNPDVFDTVRRTIIHKLEADYSHVLGTRIREHVRVDVVEIDPASWEVDGKLNGGPCVDFEVTIRSDSDATDEVIQFLRQSIGDRYGPHVDPDAVRFERIGMRPRAWFVDAKIPPSE